MHFYFVCWSTVWRMLELIRLDSGLGAPLAVAYRKHRHTAERFDTARDHLKHFDERLPGARKQRGRMTRRPLAKPWDLGNLAGSTFSFGGDGWDVSAASLKALEAMVADYRDAICTAGARS